MTKKKVFHIASVIAFLVPMIDLLYYMVTLLFHGNKYGRFSIVFILLYYVPFGIAELIAYNSATRLLFREKWEAPKKVQSIVALIASALFMVVYFAFLCKTFMPLMR